jgi:hypothetical protein
MFVDPKFPLRIEIHDVNRVNEETGEPLGIDDTPKPIRLEGATQRQAWDGVALSADPRQAMIDARQNERFAVVLVNDTERRVAVNLLVDGINTVGKKPELLGEGGCWILEPKSKWPVYAWYSYEEDRPGEKDNGGQGVDKGKAVKRRAVPAYFVFDDIEKAVARRLGSDDKIGLITAAFYREAEGRGPGLGVGEIKGGPVQVDVKPFNRGKMLATVQIGYSNGEDADRSAAR